MATSAARTRTSRLAHSKEDTRVVVDVFAGDANSILVAPACNDACASNDMTMVRTVPLITVIEQAIAVRVR